MKTTKTKNTHLDFRRSPLGQVRYYCPSFKPGDKILVRENDLDQWQEATVCEDFWHMNFGTVDAVLLDGTKSMFSQFRPLVLEETEHPPVKGFIVRVIDGKFPEHYRAAMEANLYGEIKDTELEDIIITSSMEIRNDYFEMVDTPFGTLPSLRTKGEKLVEVKTFKLFAKDEKHAEERVAALLAKNITHISLF